MSGVVAGLIGSVKAAAATPTNLVTNPSFTVNTVDWYSDDSTLTRDTTIFRSAPASLAYSGNDASPATYYYKTNLLTIGQSYSLSIWVRSIYDQGFFNITLQTGTGFTTLSTTVSASSSFTNYKIENVLCTGNTNLQVFIASESPAYIDDISVVQGATALVL